MGEDEDEQYECQVEGCDEVWDSSRSRGRHLSSHSDVQIKSEMLRDVSRVAEKIDETPRLEDMNLHGKFTGSSIACKFDSWNDALGKCGFSANQSWGMEEETLVRELRRLANELGRNPQCKDMEENGKYSAAIYSIRFEGWEDALHSAGLEVDYFGPDYDPIIYGPDWDEHRDAPLSRDDNQCRVCSDISGVVSADRTDVHHITPIKEFGVFDSESDVDYEAMNHPSNLITLCASCHRKFEGNWTEATPEEFARYAKAKLKGKVDNTSSEVSHEIASD